MSHAYCTNHGPFGCPVLSEPNVMLCAMPVTVRIGGLGQLLDQQLCVVSRGQLLGFVGNSGNSGAPHLHFEIMAGPSSLEVNGLPFVFDKMQYQGAVTGTWQHFLDDLFAGRSVQVDSARSGIRTGQMPLTLDVMSYM